MACLRFVFQCFIFQLFSIFSSKNTEKLKTFFSKKTEKPKNPDVHFPVFFNSISDQFNCALGCRTKRHYLLSYNRRNDNDESAEPAIRLVVFHPYLNY